MGSQIVVQCRESEVQTALLGLPCVKR